MRGMLAVTAAALLAACGGVREPDVRGSVSVDGISTELGGARGTVLNTPRAVYWGGIAMPALARIDLFGTEVPVDAQGLAIESAVPLVTFTVPAGPGGDFYAGTRVMPASLEMQLGGVKVFVPDSLLCGCRVSLSGNPLESGVVGVEMSLAFEKGHASYEGSFSGAVCFPGTATPAVPPGYPAWPLPDSVWFSAADSVFRPAFFAAIDRTICGREFCEVYAFLEPFAGSPPAKVTQSCIRFLVPVESMDGEPASTMVEIFLFLPDDTLAFSAGTAYCWASAVRTGTAVEASFQFQGNGSTQATALAGGGSFTAPVK